MKRNLVLACAAIAACALTAGAAVAGPVTNTIPEPATLTLFAGGIGALAIIRYLRGK